MSVEPSAGYRYRFDFCNIDGQYVECRTEAGCGYVEKKKMAGINRYDYCCGL